jgi:1-acyl-sn-glycerol-3-phosphate acyltransferase
MRIARVIYRLVVFVVAGFVCLADYARRRLAHRMTTAQRAAWLQQWCRFGLRMIGSSVIVEGRTPTHGLIVSNHLSYVDILVYSSIAPCVFVSKREVRSWPVFGWIATLAGSIYIDRRRPGDTHRVTSEMVRALEDEQPVVLFPEGTSSDGSAVLRFHSSLFEAAVTTEAPITAAYLAYEVSDGSVARDVCYWGNMRFPTHILRLFAIRHVQAHVRFSPTANTFNDRKIAAAATRSEVISLSEPKAVSKRTSH